MSFGRKGIKVTARANKPAPTVMAGGLGGSGTTQYEIKDGPDHDGPGKPPYRVPLMAEVRRIKPTGLTVATTFAGCGGSSLGYRMAGFRVVWANEFVEIALKSYAANADPRTVLDGRDIKLVKPGEILSATGLAKGELDVLDGSPPCQPFSTAGLREKGWNAKRQYGDHEQERAEDLFFEYVRLLAGLMPRSFIAENVSGLVKGKAKGYFLEVLARLKAAGYRVRAQVLDAQWLGVPQARQRVIFVGAREDLGLDPTFPAPLPYRYSIRDALPWLAGLEEADGFHDHQLRAANRPASPVLAGRSVRASDVRGVRMGAHGYFPGKIHSADKPAPAVCGSGLGSFDYEVIGKDQVAVKHGTTCSTRRKRGQALDVGKPLPTVMGSVETGRGGGQFIVETFKGERSVDQPAPTIMTHGSDKTFNQLQVKQRPVAASRVPGAYGFKEVDPKQPCPTVTCASPGNDLAVRKRVIHDDGYGRQEDATNKPARTVRSGRGGTMKVEARAIYDDGYGKPAEDVTEGPAPTVRAKCPSQLHVQERQAERRKFTIAELKRICAFPDDFELVGSYSQQWARLGNSVPPLMMRAVAERLRDDVLLPARNAARAASRPGSSRTGKRRKGGRTA